MNFKKGFAPVIFLPIVILFVSVTVGAFYVFKKNNNEAQDVSVQQLGGLKSAKKLSESKINSDISADGGNGKLISGVVPSLKKESSAGTVGWKIYKDNDYGIEFKYPAEWTIGDDDKSRLFIKMSNISTPFSQGEPLLKDQVAGYFTVSDYPISEFEVSWQNLNLFSSLNNYYKNAGRFFEAKQISYSKSKKGNHTVLKRITSINGETHSLGYGVHRGYYIDYAISDSNLVTYGLTFWSELPVTEITERQFDVLEELVGSLKTNDQQAL